MTEPLKYSPPAGTPQSILEKIQYAEGAYTETLDQCGDLEPRDRQQAAIMAWRCCLPTLEDLDSIKAFIACIASGQARRWLPAEDAKALTYTAQLALTAWQEAAGKRQRCKYPRSY